MKKYILCSLILINIMPAVSFGESMRVQKLIEEKQRKVAELEKCMGAKKGFKIAGISTLGLTAVGVAGNIMEANKIKEYDKNIEHTEKQINDTQIALDKTRAEAAKSENNIVIVSGNNTQEQPTAPATAVPDGEEKPQAKTFAQVCSDLGGTYEKAKHTYSFIDYDGEWCTTSSACSAFNGVFNGKVNGVVDENNNIHCFTGTQVDNFVAGPSRVVPDWYEPTNTANAAADKGGKAQATSGAPQTSAPATSGNKLKPFVPTDDECLSKLKIGDTNVMSARYNTSTQNCEVTSCKGSLFKISADKQKCEVDSSKINFNIPGKQNSFNASITSVGGVQDNTRVALPVHY